MEFLELSYDAAYSGQWRMLDSLYENGYQQAPTALKQILNKTIVSWTAGDGIIDTLEWAWDKGMHGDAESCMWTAVNGHLHVLQWLQEDGATWDSCVISCAEECAYDYVVEWARENGCPENKLDQMILCTGTWPSIISCVTTIIMWITTIFHRPNCCIT
jgi:hypothetical protein